MNWEMIKKGVGSSGMFKYKDIFIKIRINDVQEFENGELWFGYTFLDHMEYSPRLVGFHINNANCCWNNNYRGWFSTEIKDTLVLIGNPHCDV